jgi:hypothetical protein
MAGKAVTRPRRPYARRAGTWLAPAALFAVFTAFACEAIAQGTGPATAATPPAATTVAPTNNIHANLNISPKRVTFDRLGRTATVYVFNQGTGPATFDIQLVDRIMLPDGQIVAVDEAASKPELKPYLDKLLSAKAMVVTAPRRATLAPGKGQTIRIRAEAPVAGAAGNPPQPGEYRTHLTVTTIPPRDIGLTAEQAAIGNPRELRFQINSVFGISIPLIIRVGPPDVRGSIEKVSITTENLSPDGTSPPRPTSVLKFEIVRSGTSSLFGNIEVRGAKEKGSKDPMGLARGVGVYTEIDHRQMQIPLKRTPAPGEQLEISFKDDDTAPGRVVATTTFKTP